MASTRHSDEQKAQALAIYRDHGPAEAARQTGISRTTISSWASRAGIATDAPARIRAATETAAAKNHRLRVEMNAQILVAAHDIAGRLNAPYDDVVPVPGKGLVDYTLPKPPLPHVRQGSQAVETLVKTLRLEEGETTSNQGVTVSEGFSLDAELESFTRGAAAAAGSAGGVAEHGTTGAAATG